MIKAVIYDLDNTLYDEREYFLSAFRAVSEYASESYEMSVSNIYNVLVSLLDEKGSLYPYLFNDAFTKLGLVYDLTYIERLVSIFHNIHRL